VLEHSKTELDGHLDKATRTWNVALVLGDLGEHKKAGEKLQDAVNSCEIAFGEVDSYMLDSHYGYTPLVWAAGNGYIAVVNLLLAKDSIDLDLKDHQYRQTPLCWAVERGHEVVVKLLLDRR
jgi:ankyrin repeat protein